MRLMGWLTTMVVCDYFMILLIWWPLAPINSDTMPSGTKIMTENASFFVRLKAPYTSDSIAFAHWYFFSISTSYTYVPRWLPKWDSPYLDVAPVEVGDREVRVEANVLDLVCRRHACEPFLQVAQLAQYVIVHVDLEAEDLALLELRLQIGIAAPTLALFITEWLDVYLTGELCRSLFLRVEGTALSMVVLRCRLGLSAIN